MTAPPDTHSCWILTDGKIGMLNQCLGLARALDRAPDIKTIDLRRPWTWLPPALIPAKTSVITADSAPLVPPWPALLIASGRKSVAPAQAIRRASGGATFCVQIQDPGIPAGSFDLIVAPAHDRLRGDNVVTTLGAMQGVDPAALEAARVAFANRVSRLPRPLAGVLLGGDNAVYRMTPEIGTTLAVQLRALAADQGWGLAITPSRRTPVFVIDAIRKALTGLDVDIWDETGPNPYLGFLAHADSLIVTGDSVNMVSEAAATGKPVHVVHLEGGSKKFSRFHAAMVARGITRPFAGALEQWSYDPPDDMAVVVGEIQRRMAARERA
ncbi:MAG: mitochondrial fission ELM1 family protein [Proteobacteria bacterium]|nr:mitochondrial fission ELM1 family protein [Pseudomonadota bacterium]